MPPASDWGGMPALVVAAPVIQLKALHPLEQERSYGYEDQVVRRVLEEHLIPTPEGFGIVRPVNSNVYAALRRGDKEEIYDVDREEEELAKKWMKRHFHHMIGKFGPIAFEKVEINPDTSAGFPFRCSKQKAVWDHYDYLRWYTQPGNSDRPWPIWKITPKVEYLKRIKIEEDKIRLFRNPPLDYLILEKVIYTTQDEVLTTYSDDTWLALGFVKENGGWDAFIRSLMKRGKYFYEWDVENWDKAYGPELERVCSEIRKTFFHDYESVRKDVDFLCEGAAYAFELLLNGWVMATGLDQKSGRLLTSSNNSLAHIFMLYIHYIRFCKKSGLVPTYDSCMSAWTNKVYSDDIAGATNQPELVDEDFLRSTYELFGMGVKDYRCSTNVIGLTFLGAKNIEWEFDCGRRYVPKYDSARMMYALLVNGGRVSTHKRAERINGLYHNLAFSEYLDVMDDLIVELKALGEWPDDVPVPSQYQAQIAYTAMESREGNINTCYNGDASSNISQIYRARTTGEIPNGGAQ